MRIALILATLVIFSIVATFCVTSPFFSYKEALIAEVIKETTSPFSMVPIYNGKVFLNIPILYAWVSATFCKVFSFLPFPTSVLLRFLSVFSLLFLLGLSLVVFEKKEEYLLFLLFFLAVPKVLEYFISISPVPVLGLIDFLAFVCISAYLEKESAVFKRVFYLVLGTIFVSQGILAFLSVFLLSLVFGFLRNPKKSLKLLLCFSAPIFVGLPLLIYLAIFYFKLHNPHALTKLLVPFFPHFKLKVNTLLIERSLFAMLKEFFVPVVAVLVFPFIFNSEGTKKSFLYALSFFFVGIALVLIGCIYPLNTSFLFLSRLFFAGFFACLLEVENTVWVLRTAFLWLTVGVFVFSLQTTCLADKLTYRVSIIKSAMKSIADKKVVFWKRLNPIMLYYLGPPREVVKTQTQLASLKPDYVISKQNLGGMKIYRIIFDPYSGKLYYILRPYE